jgi:predicted dehydrogenase
VVILDPGHFHAALTLRERHPRLNDDVHVFAEDGPDVEAFLRIVESFNTRAINPTRWEVHVYRGADFMEKLIAQRPGELVIIAGKNDRKMQSIRRLHEQGFQVLGDKPWLIDSADIESLRKVTATAPLAMDIMTERHEIANAVQKALAADAAVFGSFAGDDDHPAIAMTSVHHLYKRVNGKPLQRPAWFFDLAAQGEGMTDVTTHLVDLAQWITADDRPFDYARDVQLLSARQWPTEVPPDIFSRITGLDDYPETLRDHVENGLLQYLCNASLSYRLRGVPVQVDALWGLEEARGGGDLHRAVLRGSGASLIIEQGPHTGFVTELSVHPAGGGETVAAALAEAVARLQPLFPGLGFEPAATGFRMIIPKALRTTHEQHFAAVLQEFLGFLDSGRPPASLRPDLDTKYTLLARALELSRDPAAAMRVRT